jgi:nitrogen-specific signal transduction histidine kinase
VREGRTALGGRPLDLIINELAHEFKNPLVTIKTFAHHLRRAIPSGGDEEQDEETRPQRARGPTPRARCRGDRGR